MNICEECRRSTAGSCWQHSRFVGGTRMTRPGPRVAAWSLSPFGPGLTPVVEWLGPSSRKETATMSKRLTVHDDIPDLLRELQIAEQKLHPDEDYWHDPSDLLRGALLYRIDEANEQLADRIRTEG